MPRSGTSISFGAFSAHRDLSWFSQYMNRFPRVPGLAVLSRAAAVAEGARKDVARHGVRRSLGERLQIAPSEAYEVWRRLCGDEFVYGYLLGATPTPRQARRVRGRVSRTMRLQGKPRFAAKLTGPGRIGYLSAIFPEAYFVHVIRDPRAVVDSLMRVGFWRNTFRYREPAWRGGLAEDELEAWRRTGSPEALAAVQWGAVLRTTRSEAAGLRGDHYLELRYEDFIADPHESLRRLFEFSDLRDDPDVHRFADRRLAIRDLGEAWRDRLDDERLREIDGLLADPMSELGYASAGSRVTD
jgi:omega-hydroxy-beta-dihydromenaquinone-9 sulfotransferase